MGDRDRASYLINEEFAQAWIGYNTPDPLVLITSPSTPSGYGSHHIGRQEALPAGTMTVSWEANVFLEGAGNNRPRYVEPDLDRQALVTSVAIYQGGTKLGEADGISGSN